MRELDWYFDFVSGYAYLQFEMLDRLAKDVTVRCKPILFAGLLNHFGHIGPAELAPKRQHTYQHWVWLGRTERYLLDHAAGTPVQLARGLAVGDRA